MNPHAGGYDDRDIQELYKTPKRSRDHSIPFKNVDGVNKMRRMADCGASFSLGAR